MDPAQASGWLPRRPEPAEPQRTQVQAKAKAKRSFRKEIREDERLDFGKHKGKTFKEALQADLYYAIWCSQVNEQSLPMRRFLQYAEDQGVVQSKRPKVETEPKGSSAPEPVSVATLDSFAFAPAAVPLHRAPQPYGGTAQVHPEAVLPQQQVHQELLQQPPAQAIPQSLSCNPSQQGQAPVIHSNPLGLYQQSTTSQHIPSANTNILQQPRMDITYQHTPGGQGGALHIAPNHQTVNQQAPPHLAHTTQIGNHFPPTSTSPGAHQSLPHIGQNVPTASNQQALAPQTAYPEQHAQPYLAQTSQAATNFPQSTATNPPHQSQGTNQHQQQVACQSFPASYNQQVQQAVPPHYMQNQAANQQVPPHLAHASEVANRFPHPAPSNPANPQPQSHASSHFQPAHTHIQYPNQQPAHPVHPAQPHPAQPVHPAPPVQAARQDPAVAPDLLDLVQQPPQTSPPQMVTFAKSPAGGPAQPEPKTAPNPLADYDGIFEVELGRDGFFLLPSKRLKAKAFATLKTWDGAKTDSKRLHFESHAYTETVDRLRELCQSRCAVKEPPNWVLAMLPAFRTNGRVQVAKKVAHVLLADFKADPLSSDAQSREGNKVLPYQREAVDFALKRGGRVLLGDEMGLGKTAQALTLAAQFPKDFPLLVVCPSSLRGNWREEAARWLPNQLLPNPERHVQIIRDGKDSLRKSARVVVVSYDLVARNETFRRTARGDAYRMVICDEAHYLKTPKSQRSEALRPVLQHARRCALLTGTPALAKASEIYALLQSLLPGLLPDNHNKFCERYCNEKKIFVGRRQVKQWEGSRLGDELFAILEMVMVRRFKKDVLNQLPSKRRQRVLLDKLSNDGGVLKELKEKMRDFHSPDEEQRPEGGGATELFRLTGLAKMAAVAEYVQYLVEADCRFLLFAHHQVVMDTMQQTLEKLKVGFIRIDGKTPAQKREQLVNDFRSRPQLQVALLSITACGQGLNLQVCSTVVFAELHWTPGVLLQAEDRAHRMGQKESVNVHYLIAKDTLDESIYQMLERKQHDVGLMLDGHASRLGAEKVGTKGTFTKSAVPETGSDADADAGGGDGGDGGSDVGGEAAGAEPKGPKQQTLCFKKQTAPVAQPAESSLVEVVDASQASQSDASPQKERPGQHYDAIDVD